MIQFVKSLNPSRAPKKKWSPRPRGYGSLSSTTLGASLPSALQAFTKRRLVRSIAVLSGSAAASQAIGLTTAPFAARLYTPEHFGMFGVFTAMTSILLVMAGFRLELAIPLPKDDQQAFQLMAASAIWCLGLTMIIAAGVLAYSQPIAQWMGMPSLAPWLGYLPVAVLVGGIGQSLRFWMIRRKEFQSMGRARIGRSLVRSGSLLGFGALNLCPGGLFLSHVCWLGAETSMLLYRFFQRDWRATNRISRSGVIQVCAKYRSLVFTAQPASIIAVVVPGIVTFYLAGLFGKAGCGCYLLAQNLSVAPVYLVGTAVAQVLFAEFTARSCDQARRRKLFGKINRRLAISGILVAVPSISAPLWIPTLLGEPWILTGWLLLALTPLLLAKFVFVPLNHLYTVYHRQSSRLGIECIRLGMTVLWFEFASRQQFDILTTVFGYSLLAAAAFACHWFVLFSITRAEGEVWSA